MTLLVSVGRQSCWRGGVVCSVAAVLLGWEGGAAARLLGCPCGCRRRASAV